MGPSQPSDAAAPRRRRADGRRRVGLATVALAAAFAGAGCGGTMSYWTYPALLVRPGAPVFYVETRHLRERVYSQLSYHRAPFEESVLATRYAAVDLASCRRLRERTLPGALHADAWDPVDEELWLTDVHRQRTWSVRGGETTLPAGAWTRTQPPQATRFWVAPAADGRGPRLWDVHAHAVLPIPGAADAPTTIDAVFAAPGRTIAFGRSAALDSIDLIIVDDARAGTPGGIARWSAPTRTSAFRTARLIDGRYLAVMDDRGGELFDVATGRRLQTLDASRLVGSVGWQAGPAARLAYVTPAPPGADGRCQKLLALIDPVTTSARRFTLPVCPDELKWLDEGPFAVATVTAAAAPARWLFDAERVRLMAVPTSAGAFTALAADLYYLDGPDAARRLMKADFQTGTAHPATGPTATIHALAADPASRTLLFTAGDDTVAAYRVARGIVERCGR